MRAGRMAMLLTGLWLIGLGLGGCVAPQRNAYYAPPVQPGPALQGPSNQALSADLSPAPPPDALMTFGDAPPADGFDEPFENRVLTNLTRHSFSGIGGDFDPDLDREGRLIVFASTRNSERPDLFLKTVDGTAIEQLTSDPADDIQPRFNADASKIAFASNRSGNWDIWQVNRDGTGLMQLTRDDTDEVAPCWSPDGQRIAFTVWGRRSHNWEIWTLSVSEPGVRRFLCYGMFPTWSPDGTKLTFQRARQRGSRWFSVWTIELVGLEARHPTEVAYREDAACIAPRWSPDGELLVYCAVKRAGDALRYPPRGALTADLWAVELSSGQRFKLTDGASPAFNPTWNKDGRIFFVSARAGAENIWAVQPQIEGYSIAGVEKTSAPISLGPDGLPDVSRVK